MDSIPYGFCHCGCGQKTKIATATREPFGAIKGQPLRYVHGHNAHGRRVSYAVEDRGYSSPCWVWQGKLDKNGYGRTYVRSLSGPMLAHRFIYQEHRGPIDSQVVLHHLCELPACVNPAHLQAMTHREHQHIHNLRGVCDKGHPLPERSPSGARPCRVCRDERCRNGTGKKTALICSVCGSTFLGVREGKKRTRKTCSRECRHRDAAKNFGGKTRWTTRTG